MTIDRYTKIVLTVIALCLVWLSLGGPAVIPSVDAQRLSKYDRVLVAGWVDRKGFEHAFPMPEPPETAIEQGAGLPTQVLPLGR